MHPFVPYVLILLTLDLFFVTFSGDGRHACSAARCTRRSNPFIAFCVDLTLFPWTGPLSRHHPASLLSHRRRGKIDLRIRQRAFPSSLHPRRHSPRRLHGLHGVQRKRPFRPQRVRPCLRPAPLCGGGHRWQGSGTRHVREGTASDAG